MSTSFIKPGHVRAFQAVTTQLYGEVTPTASCWSRRRRWSLGSFPGASRRGEAITSWPSDRCGSPVAREKSSPLAASESLRDAVGISQNY